MYPYALPILICPPFHKVSMPLQPLRDVMSLYL